MSQTQKVKKSQEKKKQTNKFKKFVAELAKL